MTPEAFYVCPMHRNVRLPDAGTCPKCHMPLVLEGSRFRILRHMVASPLHIGIMVVVMLALMAVAMTIMR
jgi:transposase